MPFCSNCGIPVEGQFCAQCGKPVAASQPGAGGTAAQPAPIPAAGGLTDNVAGLLCYVLGFITGIVFLVVPPYSQKRFVRFHAFQSIFLSVAWFAVSIVEGIINRFVLLISWHLLAAVALVWTLIGLGFLVLWILLLVKAYQGQQWKLPIIGDLAEKRA